MTPERPKIAVVTFLGSLDDHDATWALAALDAEALLVWHAETELPQGTSAVVLPAVSPTATTCAAGAIARFAPIMDAVTEFAAAGGSYSASATASRFSARRGCSRRPDSQRLSLFHLP